MNKTIDHTNTTEKTAHKALELVKYYFLCTCGCGQVSENLGKEYIRLRKGQKWYSKGCHNGLEAQPFKGGFIVKESDF